MMLEALSNARGVSGDESRVRELVAGAIREHVDEYHVDALGNLIAVRRAERARRNGRAPLKVLVAAHTDEVGLLVTHIDAAGFLEFDKVGGIDDRILPAQPVQIGATGVPGVIGFKPQHRSSYAERQRVVAAEQLRIDIGARSALEAAEYVRPGDYVTFAATFTPIGDHCARGKALDDRVGCALLVELVKQNSPVDLYAAFTTQEEVGLRGAQAAGYVVAADVALVLEATICDDSPKTREQSPTTRLRRGPAITIADRGLLADKRLVRLLEEQALAHELPYQFKQPLVGGTDAGQLHRLRAGVPSAVLSVPARYIHSPAAVVSLDDIENTLRLARAFLERLGQGMPEHA